MGSGEEERLAKFFGDAFREVVLPVLEDMHAEMKAGFARLAGDLGQVEGEVQEVKVRLGRVEGELGRLNRNLQRHGEMFDGQEERIAKIEAQLPRMAGR